MEGEQECIPHVIRVLEGIQQRYGVRSQVGLKSVLLCEMTTFPLWSWCPDLLFQTSNGLSEESSTEHLEFPLLTQRSLRSITQLLPFLRTLCCSFQGPPPYGDPMPHCPVADYPAASTETVLKKLELITEEEFLDSMESWKLKHESSCDLTSLLKLFDLQP